MPSINSRTTPLPDSYSPVATNPRPAQYGTHIGPTTPGRNPLLRTPLPPVTVSPDSLRQFFVGGNIPQSRILPATPLSEL